MRIAGREPSLRAGLLLAALLQAVNAHVESGAIDLRDLNNADEETLKGALGDWRSLIEAASAMRPLLWEVAAPLAQHLYDLRGTPYPEPPDEDDADEEEAD